MTTKIGKLFIVTSGSYSDYQIVGTFRVLREDVVEGAEYFKANVRTILSAGKTIVKNYVTQYPRRIQEPRTSVFAHPVFTETLEDYKARIDQYLSDLAKEKETHLVECELGYSVTALLGYLSREGYIEDADIPELYDDDFLKGLKEL